MADRGLKKQIKYELVVSSEPDPGFLRDNRPELSVEIANTERDTPATNSSRPYTPTQKSLLVTGMLNLGYVTAQLIVAARFHSLAMMSDAFHNLSDAGGMGYGGGERGGKGGKRGKGVRGVRRWPVLLAAVGVVRRGASGLRGVGFGSPT